MLCLGFLLQIPQIGFFQLPLCLFRTTVGAHLDSSMNVMENGFSTLFCRVRSLKHIRAYVRVFILTLDTILNHAVSNFPGCIPGTDG